jgi:putative flippase GtrA
MTVTEEAPPKRLSSLRRVGKFGIVGIFNTLIDFVLYNFFSGSVGFTLIQANILSTTVAMGFSFLGNKKLVFKKHDGHWLHQAALFYAITAFGLYVIQTGTIHVLTEVWFYPLHLALVFFHAIGITGHDAFLIKNGAKAFGTVLSLSWNYYMYKKVVFR